MSSPGCQKTPISGLWLQPNNFYDYEKDSKIFPDKYFSRALGTDKKTLALMECRRKNIIKYLPTNYKCC